MSGRRACLAEFGNRIADAFERAAIFAGIGICVVAAGVAAWGLVA